MDNLISIIVPVYNTEKYISNCIDSIKNQSYKNFEIIIVNDGSTDNSLQLIKTIAEKDRRIKIIDKKNEGVTAARLDGVKAASGEYIGFVDSDDIIEPYMYEFLLDNALKYNAQISHCGYQMVFPNRVDMYYNTGCLAQQDKVTALKELLSGSRIEPGLCNKLFHKTLFHSLLHTDLMDMSIKINEDLLMNYYLFREAENTIYEDKCPYKYIVRKNSAANSSINSHQLKDPVKVAEIILKDSEKFDSLKTAARQKYINNLISITTMSASGNKSLILPFQKECRKKLKKEFIKNMNTKEFNIKYKSKVFVSSLLPDVYKLIHNIYLKITGLDKIYDIE